MKCPLCNVDLQIERSGVEIDYCQLNVSGISATGCESGFDTFLKISYNSVIYPDPIAACETAAWLSEFRDGRR